MAVLQTEVYECRVHRTYRSSEYWCEYRTDLTEVPGTGMSAVQDSQNCPVGRTLDSTRENAPGMVL